MASIGESGLKAQIKSESYSNAYFIYGEESYLKAHYVQKLRKKIVDPAFEDFNCHTYENKNISLGEILRDAEMLPMMSRYNLVLVYDYPFDNKEDIEEIKAFLGDVPDTTILIFVFETVEVDPKKNSKWKGLINAFAKAGSAVNLEKRSESDLAKMLVNGAKKRGAVLSTENARYLISVAGNDIQTLMNEIDKLCMYCKDGEITKNIIDNMAAKCLQARVYDLSKFILKQDTAGAYAVLRTLFEMGEEPIGILAIIANCYVDMYRVKCAKIAGASYEDVGNYYNYKGREFVLRNALRDSSKLSVTSLRKSLDVLSEADYRLKSTAADKKIILEETVIKLVMIAGAGQ